MEYLSFTDPRLVADKMKVMNENKEFVSLCTGKEQEH